MRTSAVQKQYIYISIRYIFYDGTVEKTRMRTFYCTVGPGLSPAKKKNIIRFPRRRRAVLAIEVRILLRNRGEFFLPLCD